jgi:hypothetical protein
MNWFDLIAAPLSVVIIGIGVGLVARTWTTRVIALVISELVMFGVWFKAAIAVLGLGHGVGSAQQHTLFKIVPIAAVVFPAIVMAVRHWFDRGLYRKSKIPMGSVRRT